MADAPTSTTLQTILAQFRDEARSNRDLGDRFERMMHRYFELDPIYADRFSDVWMWNDWPQKGKVGDVGIDLVARERATGEYCGIQCKFYLPEHTIAKADLDSFFAALGKPQFTSGMIVSTTDNWGKNADDALHQTKPVTRLSVHDLEASPIDWSKFDIKRPQALGLKTKKKLRPHQQQALKDVTEKLATADRGKLIMACGTGKTFTALRIAEAMAPKGHVLFLVPSLSLLSQSLREWTAESTNPLRSLAVCSDVSIGKSRKKADDDAGEITIYDLAYPATTNAKQLVAQYEVLRASGKKDKDAARMTVVFSTYQSIEAVSKAQKAGLPDFDLIICDEAHRTTGVTLSGEDESSFVKVHDAKFLKGKKRLYMTATPRIYGDEAKTKAKEVTAELASMDDTELFGEELHRLGFGEAVGKSLLSDYKVLVLAVDEKYVSKTFQKQIADKNTELNLDDAVKITGCWNGLNKKFEAGAVVGDELQGDVAPMRRAVAFSRSIKDSKAFAEQTRQIVAAYRESHPDATGLLELETDHVDGTFDALKRAARLDWLKADSPDNTCRILSNARCLSEGVDVPALDAVLFLNPRNSVVDVVQSVGRVMRRAEGKRYGYIILPIGIPADTTPEEALKNNEKYKVVWQVLQALRAHDDRFNATINQLELNENRPSNIQVIGVGGGDNSDSSGSKSGDSKPKVREIQGVFAFPHLDEWKDAIYAKMVLKCGDRAYWETWARSIGEIAKRHITRIKAILDEPTPKQAKAFAAFLKGLQTNLNPAVDREEAIEMLAQHLITKPVFDSLFAHYAFTQHNPVSQSMEQMLEVLHEEAIEKETATLDKFYASVRDRAAGIDNAAARQTVIKELYEEFFKNAFNDTHDRLGIVYTPNEVVDFIIHSVQDVLRDEFQSGLGEKDVHIIDPWTGTGTFIVRLLQSGLIPPEKLMHKYRHELHANEIVLLAYYIAAINIEETFHGLYSAATADRGKAVDYIPFDGIVLTDTFQLYESKQTALEGTFPENTARVKRQKAAPIRVVIANPPYSAQQESENDNNKNLEYPQLDQRIRSTYAEASNAKLVKNLYDSYIRGIRWATDRIADRGVIGIVTNGSFIDANNMDGLRACLAEEFTSVYVFNLRGNARTQGELRRTEAGNVFGGGTRTPVSVTLLVKNPSKTGACEIRYHDIGDYLSREDKLAIVRGFASIGGIAKAGKWKHVKPNPENDWINQRDPAFEQFPVLGDKEAPTALRFFEGYTQGLLTSRDKWVYGFGSKVVESSVKRMIATYNNDLPSVVEAVAGLPRSEREAAVSEIINTDQKQISWSRALKNAIGAGKKLRFKPSAVVSANYRPFTRQWVCFDRELNEFVYQLPSVFPEGRLPNLLICVDSRGSTKDFSALISDRLPDYEFISKGQCFPLFLYEAANIPGEINYGDADDMIIDGYCRIDAVTDEILATFRKAYGEKVTKEDIFYYVYGVLHSPEYRTRFASDLKKMLPRIPLTKEAKDFKAFSKAGRSLAEWHLNYETVDPWPVKEFSEKLDLDTEEKYKVQKMTFARPTPQQKAAGEKYDKSTIVYNSHVTLKGIPLEAYNYVVNGKPAIEWVMERYQFTRDKDSGIVNDPNDWCNEHNEPRYIIDLVKRIVRVSMETIKIVKALPALNEQKAAR